jgi:hypothetical protein
MGGKSKRPLSTCWADSNAEDRRAGYEHLRCVESTTKFSILRDTKYGSGSATDTSKERHGFKARLKGGDGKFDCGCIVAPRN